VNVNHMTQSSHYLIKSYLESTHDKPRTAVDRVYEDILRRIVNLELPPGSPLVRSDLCSEYKVSQTPVREALLRLEQLGLVNVRPQSGTEVAYIDIAQLEQNHFLREALECEVVKRLAEQCDQTLVSHLRSVIEMQESVAVEGGDIMLFAKLDELFHRSMFEAVGQSALYHLVRSRSGHMDRVRRLHLPSEGKIRDVLKGHHNIVTGIEQGNPEQAIKEMRDHLAGTIERVRVLKDEYPDYFC
jgi:DNA-binding GntR family transcriptional regulator